jgi:hypothetical protein
MDSKALNRRSWIKNVAIIFLAAMLFLTFFSNTIMNFSLPEVSAQYPSSGSITTRVRKTGNVAATEDYEVVLDETRNLLSVEVKKGDKVAIGDLLFTLEEGDSKEVEEAIKAYENAKVAYDKAVLALDMDYTTLTNSINDASNELAKLRKKHNSSGNEKEVIKELDTEIRQLNREISVYESQYPPASEMIVADYSIIGKSNNQVLADAKNLFETSLTDIDKAKIAYDKAKENLDSLTAKEKELKKAYDKATKDLSDFKAKLGIKSDSDSGVSFDTEFEAIQKQKRDIDALELQRRRALEDLDILYDNWQKAISTAYNDMTIAFDAYQKAKEQLEKDEITQAEFDVIESAYTKASDSFASTQSTQPSSILDQERAIEDIRIKITQAKDALAVDEAKYGQLLNSSSDLTLLERAVTNAKSAHDTVTEELADATEDEKDLKEDYEEIKKISKGYYKLQLETEVAILNDIVQDKKDEKADIEAEAGDPVTDTAIENAEKTLKKAQEALDEQKKKDEKAHESELLQLDVDKKNLERLQANIERLQKNNVGTEVRAKIAGMVSDINYVAGNEVKAGNVLAKLQIVDKGYYVEFDVTNEEAARIRPGEVAAIQYYWGPTIEATVESIKNSTSNQGKAKVVRIAIVGEIEVGRQLTFNLGERGQNYDTIVPKSAIREDSNGKFILTVVSKSTPLGNRYSASRVDVTVLAEDDTNCAINLGLYGSEFIITTSTKPIKDGDQVRLVDR